MTGADIFFVMLKAAHFSKHIRAYVFGAEEKKRRQKYIPNEGKKSGRRQGCFLWTNRRYGLLFL